METDPEILDEFSNEIIQIRNQLKPIMEKLRVSYEGPQFFEEFGQTIDRIYGTAATLGYKEVAEFCRSMKVITYKVSQSANLYAKGQVKDMCMVALALLEKFPAIVKNPEEVKKIQYTMQKERQKADEIARKHLGDIKRATTDK